MEPAVRAPTHTPITLATRLTLPAVMIMVPAVTGTMDTITTTLRAPAVVCWALHSH
jgi:hypothetical protein